MIWMGYALAALCLGASVDLEAAEQAFRRGRYEEVLPAVDRAMYDPLEPAERSRALELKAFTHAAFEQRRLAVDAFYRLLALRPDYALPSTASPKLQALLDEAKARPPQGRELSAAARPSAPVVEPPPLETRPASRWWLWAGAGVLVAGAGAAAVYALQPKLAGGTLGRAEIR